MKPTRIAVIGLGNQGAEHVAALSQTRLPLILAAAVDPAGAREGMELPEKVPVLHNIDDIPHDVRAVIVATPPLTYRKMVPRLLESGRHVLLEKPLGVDLAEALYLVDLAERSNKVLMPAVQRRFHPTYASWPEWQAKAGRLREATIKMAIVHRGESWRASRAEAGGGALFDLGFHAIDLAQQLFGDLRLRTACFFDDHGRPCHDGFDFHADLLLHSENEVVVRIRVARGAAEKIEQVYARGDRGFLEIGREAVRFTPTSDGRVEEWAADLSWRVAMEKQMKEWTAAIRSMESGAPNRLVSYDEPAWHGATAMRMMEEAYALGRC